MNSADSRVGLPTPSPRTLLKSPGLGSYRTVGRVGALAVALGVGAWVASVPTVALADSGSASRNSISTVWSTIG